MQDRVKAVMSGKGVLIGAGLAIVLVVVLLFSLTRQPRRPEDGFAAYNAGNYAEALRLLHPLAEKGSAKAQGVLGDMYAKGHGVAQDYTAAQAWYSRAATAGDAEAKKKLEELGAHMAPAQGAATSRPRSEAQGPRGTATTAPADPLKDGIAAYQAGNYAEALRLLRPLAEQENAKAQNILGDAYARGQSVPKDDAEAVKWFRKAAEQGLAAAQYNLGVFYGNGRGVSKDDAEAAKWYRKAAEQGDSDAQNFLGLAYGAGRGVSKDDAEAAKWYRKAAEQGHVVAQYNLGVFYMNGRGVSKDDAEAAKWYRKAAEQGDSDAQNSLGFAYDTGRGVPADDVAAVGWFRKAAEQGHTVAQYNLGVSYKNGRGVPQDVTAAYMWLSLPAMAGNPNAKKQLEEVGGRMTPTQIAEAERQVAEWAVSHYKK